MDSTEPEWLPPLIERISFLVHRVNAHLLRVTNPLLKKWSIDLTESRLLVALLEGGPMSAGDLVAIMALPQSTVSHQTKRLEKLGYVKRSSGIRDSRVVVASLTDKGREVAMEANELSRTVSEQIRQAIGPVELELVRSSLQRVDDVLDPRRAP